MELVERSVSFRIPHHCKTSREPNFKYAMGCLFFHIGSGRGCAVCDSCFYVCFDRLTRRMKSLPSRGWLQN